MRKLPDNSTPYFNMLIAYDEDESKVVVVENDDENGHWNIKKAMRLVSGVIDCNFTVRQIGQN